MLQQEKTKKFYPGEKKNILVTGGAGFVGSHLCDRLVKENNVICLDALIGGSVENIRQLLPNTNFRFIKYNLSEGIPELEKMTELRDWKIEFYGIQEIYHLACPTSAKNFDALKIETLKANSLGVYNILELAKYYKSKILLGSSSVVYGPRKGDNLYFKEEDKGEVNLLSPRACYDEGKRFAEAAFMTYHQFYGLETKIARLFRTYGPREMLFDGQMVPDFFLQALTNKPLIIYGDETFSTSLCYVADIVEGLCRLMDSNETEPVNFGGATNIRLVDLASKIIELTGSSAKIEFREPLLFMTPLGLPDISKAKEKLEWFPVTTLEEGLKQSLAYTKAHRLLLEPMIKNYDQE